MTKKNHNKVFGQVLRKLRKEQGHTQETLGFECGLDRTYVSLLELGQSSPTLDTLIALCEALQISLDQLAREIVTELERSEGMAACRP